MSVLSHSRGHRIHHDGKDWRYSDNGTLLKDEERPCIRCGKYPTREGYDACMGYVENASSVCCGHGEAEKIAILGKDIYKPVNNMEGEDDTH